MTLLREQVGRRNMRSFQAITVDDVGFHRSVKQGGEDSPTLFNMVNALTAETSQCGMEGDKVTEHERVQATRTTIC